MRFAAGQRWISEPEPELGLGIVLDVEHARVKMFFPASNGMRLYASESAPLRRVRFKVGETVTSHEGESFEVQIILDRADGVLTYGGPKGERLIETQLSDVLLVDKPSERIPVGQVEDIAVFDLRTEALSLRHRIAKSPAHGFTGARIDLIPHQLGIANEVANRQSPRVLLADEVGLGKTIEACLILHRLHLTGKAERILILVPEPLVHQWFVELLRRFNLLFSIFDEERCVAIEEHNPDANPFLDDQLVLSSIGWLAHASEKRKAQLRDAGWELLIVDEAHHLTWTPKASSPEYDLVDSLGRATRGLLLLTATPQQLGAEGHFARLRLLDPDRYPSLEAFVKEADEYAPVAKIADKLIGGKKLLVKEVARLSAMPGSISRHLEALQGGDKTAAEPLLAELLDQHGTGRVMFRNTRAALKGFPKRIAKLLPLPGDVAAAQAEYRGEAVDLSGDARVKWVASFLKKLKGGKALLICRTREKAEAVEAALREETSAPVAIFHEGLTLLQRDRNAAYFAEEEGAQLLICSEIGSEGRNFQFAHHLILFDLPDNPELLEQRIGRLDRIGQSADIQIHIPHIVGGPFERLARWFHEGLGAFEENLPGAAELYAQFGDAVRGFALPAAQPEEAATAKGAKAKPKRKKAAAASECDDAAAATEANDGFDALIADSQAAAVAVRKRLADGQDRLLELNSSRPGSAAALIEEIRVLDADTTLDDFMLSVFDHFGMHVEDIAPRTWIVIPGAGGEVLPGIPQEGTTLTADRARALGREDVSFLTWDHPAVRGAFERLLGSPLGNAALGLSRQPGPESAIAEAYFVLEVIAPAELHVGRYLPPTPIRVIVNNRCEEVPPKSLGELENGPLAAILGKTDLGYKTFPRMLEHGQKLAETKGTQIIAASLRAMQAKLGAEVDRLKDLAVVNPNVSPAEIEAAQKLVYDLRDSIADARVRLDAVRLIFRASRS